ncbi:exodeoxyribonuclease VII small subunit [Geitlerinema sp. P-1104]|uniref:exodeoxyribonuclease VII small subunit n=1 Tax=Geitlerinema sp. P-1104 TaxID=2546230 RepID=UPI0014770074|nr:exodeoxyribonuclease VII small subunit [Geitlerinema sp. P-1104]NMG59100.1 exodeoxyribonuclease VII small subunit [Geitlerinema sp. P-1104]
MTHPWNYEATVEEIESIIQKIESGQLDLEAVFDKFAVAAEHLQDCEQFLGKKQQQLDILIETLGDQ